MKFSRPMIVMLCLAAAFVILRIITPTPEQQMLDYYNQQNQQMMEQNQQMLNGMQNQMVNPYSTPNISPGYYPQPQGYQQAPGYNDGGYVNPNNGYPYMENPPE